MTPNPSDLELRTLAAASVSDVLAKLKTGSDGLSGQEVKARLETYGPNIAGGRDSSPLLLELWNKFKNPLNILLFGLAGLSWLLSDLRSAAVIATMVVLSIGLGFIQEHRSSKAAAKLANMVRVEVMVKRQGAAGADAEGFAAIPLDGLVPGDIVKLSAGDMVPADVRLCSANDLYVNQSTLTGESMPVEKNDAIAKVTDENPLALPNICFMGSSISSGYGTAVVVHTGDATSFGTLARQIMAADTETSFDRGIRSFSWLMLRFILVMVPLVFLINGLTKHDWLEALFFAVAVAVGLAPEMLPMIVTVNLAQGAMAMAKKHAIVKRLDAIQNFGAMDVLCTDKTGTLTQDRVVLKLHLDVAGHNDDNVLKYAYLNSHFQSGLRNLLDVAIQNHAELEEHLSVDGGYSKIDEIPFDFNRRRLSVVVGTPEGKTLLICKGAVEEVLAVCADCRTADGSRPLDAAHRTSIADVTARLNGDGFRVIALGTREIAEPKSSYHAGDEAGLTLQGFVAFLDPPKETAAAALAALAASGVSIKILTGDNDLVTLKTCRDVGLTVTGVATGHEIEAMDDEALRKAIERTNVFAKVSPAQKARIIAALQASDHVVGFLGDGINDGPALKRADVGISVDTAADIAKESADIILLEKNLAILNEGVLEGRRVFGNIVKYIKMGASSSFGNMFSVLGASMFLPFLPMAPLQVLANNLLYDFSQTTIPTDTVDEEYLQQPRKWEIGNIMRFMLFIGPMSSIFDYATYFTMLYVFDAWSNPSLFQTGWFVESILSQTLIIHVIRTKKRPFIDSWASPPLIISTIIICAIAVALPYSPLAGTLGLQPLPLLYWPIVASFLVGYAVLTTIVKTWFIRKWGM
ncbi:magnesium-translocating P-type ATPase [Rhizobium sp. C4]|uniref:magnesium-translocating P-type ATPase n=1 Tax=Rhizobium sp. C4 TaxID=1349800 RepID=UPI001E3D0411|nr:magnesium-translocating P-type ATPase [Rhizobium sp. C4]MCD2175762.1 magnesium-translocating P-type ATPase [Rhizobium sp. C4]